MQKERNIGLDFLRILMCFLVVVCHYWDGTGYGAFVNLLLTSRNLSVPFFFFVSFLLSSSLFLKPCTASIAGKRFSRLLVPHVFAVFLAGTIVFSFVMQYSGLNREVSGGLRHELKYTSGRLLEMVPYAASALLMVKCNVLASLEKRKLLSIGLLMSVILGFFFCGTKCGRAFVPIDMSDRSFHYAGILKWITAMSITLVFYLLRTDRIPVKVSWAISFLSRLTPGVYYMHFLGLDFGMESGSILLCVMVFVVSLSLSALLSVIPVRWVRMAVC